MFLLLEKLLVIHDCAPAHGTYKVRGIMTRPQAVTAFIPISNRSGSSVEKRVGHFGQPVDVDGKWYNISAKKKADVTTAEVMIYDEIGIWGISAKDFVKELTALDADEINLHINSPGGDVFDGVAIYNALRMHSAKVTVYVDSLAASAASFIAQSGDEVIMLRNAEMMIHDASALAWGNEEDMLKTANILGRISNNIADIYAQRSGKTADSWREVMRSEMWYSAQEAVDAGLADRVLEVSDEDAEDVKNGWDLRVFNFAGRKNAPHPLEEMRKIENRAKEAPVGRTTTSNPTNEGEGAAEVPEPTETTPPVEETPDQPDQPDEPETQEPPVETPPPAPEPTALATGGFAFVVNGANVSDPRAVQQHITSLETFRSETITANRNSFIAGLAENNKILASQRDNLEKLVATMTDEQYSLWCASWDAAPVVSMLGAHGGEGGGQPTGSASESIKDRVDVLKGIVKMHQRANMPVETIKNTASFKELVALDPEFTL